MSETQAAQAARSGCLSAQPAIAARSGIAMPWRLNRSSSSWVKRRCGPRSEPPVAVSGCFSNAISSSALTGRCPSAATCRRNRPGGDWISGRPALSFARRPQRSSAAWTRRVSTRSGVTSAARWPVSTAWRRIRAIAPASSRGCAASSTVTRCIASGRFPSCGPSDSQRSVTGAGRSASEKTLLRSASGAVSPRQETTSLGPRPSALVRRRNLYCG